VKQARAVDLVADAMESGTIVTSVQVLGEFFNTVTRRIPNPLSNEEAEEIVNLFSTLPVIGLDMALVQRAITTCRRYQVSYWDALIVAAAERAGCSGIISEDLNTGQAYRGVTVSNPF
jgi:predicted nucleic acid-binding protein